MLALNKNATACGLGPSVDLEAKAITDKSILVFSNWLLTHSRSPLVTCHQLYFGRQKSSAKRALTGSCGLGCFPGRLKRSLLEAECFVDEMGFECSTPAWSVSPAWMKQELIYPVG